MPSYKVKEKGFFDGKSYDPQGKRKTLFVEKAFKKCPSWLELIKPEKTPSSKQEGPTVKELKAELKAMGVEFNSSANKEQLIEILQQAKDAAEIAANQKDIDDASFMGDGETGSNAVETL